MYNMIIESKHEKPVEDESMKNRWKMTNPMITKVPLLNLIKSWWNFLHPSPCITKSATEMNIIVFGRMRWSICGLSQEMLIDLIYFHFKLLYE
jgi:hypothetical protein